MSKIERILPKEDQEFLEDKISEAELLHLTEPDEEVVREIGTLSKKGYAGVEKYKNQYYEIISHNIADYKLDSL